MSTRRYQLKRRAEKQAETRQRIVEAIVELHQSVGPARTTVSAVAERAGVERLTVYRHFPTEAEHVAACSAHWVAGHPRPDLEAWTRAAEPAERLRAGLAELYAFFEGAEAMWSNILRDASLVPPLQPAAAGIQAYLARAVEVLAVGWPDRPLVRAALGHAAQLETWRSLVRGQGLTNAEAVELMSRVVGCLAGAEPGAAG
jgi:AcrR family transcriptional regulator